MVVVSLQSNQYSPQLFCKMKEIRTLMTWHCCIELGYKSFRRTPFQPFTLSTTGLFDRLQNQPPQTRPI